MNAEIETDVRGSHITVARREPGWSIIGPNGVEFDGMDATVWIKRENGDETGGWVIEMFAHRFVTNDVNDFRSHELTLCQTPLSEALRDEISSRQYSDHPGEAQALLASGDGENDLASLRDILLKALQYLDVVAAEPQQH